MNQLTWPLALAFLFFLGCVLGWVLEFLFRNLISHKGPKGKYFINPGFCKGPWLPIYGIGLTAMCLIATLVTSLMSIEFVYSVWGIILVILILGATMIIIEFIGGYLLRKRYNLRLWDYRDRPGNIMGIVCPLFSLIWTGVGAFYYLVVHRFAIGRIIWLSNHLAFSFFIGAFFGLFILDLIVSRQEAAIIKRFANEHDVVVQYELLKEMIQAKLKEDEEKRSFFNQTAKRGETIEENLKKHMESSESKESAYKSHRKQIKEEKAKAKEQSQNNKAE